MIELVTTDGIFALDGGEWDVTNNIWLVGDESAVVVVDAAHDHRPIVEAVAGRRVTAIACTHGHNDHINAAVALAEAVDAPIWLHPDDRMLWDVVHPDRAPDRDLADGTVLRAGGVELAGLHTPGHSPGCVCFHAGGAVPVAPTWCSRATRCSAAARARPGAATATSRRSSPRSARAC